MEHARTHCEPGRNTETRKTQRKHGAIPCRKAKSNRGCFHESSSSRIAYPTPRIVWISFRLPGGSILERNWRTYTSRVLLYFPLLSPHSFDQAVARNDAHRV